MTQPQTPANVARSATQTADLPRRGVVLLGIFGSEAAPEALVRLSGGRTARVGLGDRIGTRRVVAIDDSRIALARGGKAVWLGLPVPR